MRLSRSPPATLAQPGSGRRWLACWRLPTAALAALAWALAAASLAPVAAAATVAAANPTIPPATATATEATPDPALGGVPPVGCALLWQISVQLDALPRQLVVDMSFDAGPRNRTTLRLPSGWAGVVELAAPGAAEVANAASTTALSRLQSVSDAPALRSVAHAAGERVQLRWRLTPPTDPAAGGSVQLFEDWFALAGQGVLPVPEEIDDHNPPSACIALTGRFGVARADSAAASAVTAATTPAATSPPSPPHWASSHGLAEGASALFRVAPGAAPLRQRVQRGLYVGGALQTWVSNTDGVALTLARPATIPWRFSLEALAQASAQALVAQRRFWGDTTPAAPLLVLLLPSAGALRGSAWQQTLALQAPADLALPSPALDGLLTEALVRSWVPDRFGPLAHVGRGDEAQRAWFSEGWADFYSHRSLLREGQWTAEDYAAALNLRIARLPAALERERPHRADRTGAASAAAAAAAATPGTASPATLTVTATELAGIRGELLALQWHGALRASGQPGLDATLRRLLLAPIKASHEGPISAPLVTHRLVAALRPVLGDTPLRDISRQIEQGDLPDFGPGMLGPCFVGRRLPVATWRLGFDAASLARRVVSGVEPGGPAEAAGLRDGMQLAGHLLVPGDASQPVQLKVLDPRPGADVSASANAGLDSGEIRAIRYLPAGEPVRELPRYQPVPQAMQQPACLGWLGLGPEALQASGSRASQPATPLGAGDRTAARSGSKSAKSQGAKTGPANKSMSKAAVKPSSSAKSVHPAGAKTPAKPGAKPGLKLKATAPAHP